MKAPEGPFQLQTHGAEAIKDEDGGWPSVPEAAPDTAPGLLPGQVDLSPVHVLNLVAVVCIKSGES